MTQTIYINPFSDWFWVIVLTILLIIGYLTMGMVKPTTIPAVGLKPSKTISYVPNATQVEDIKGIKQILNEKGVNILQIHVGKDVLTCNAFKNLKISGKKFSFDFKTNETAFKWFVNKYPRVLTPAIVLFKDGRMVKVFHSNIYRRTYSKCPDIQSFVDKL